MIDFQKVRDEDLETLTPRQREVFVRRRAKQPWRQVCAEMGISMASVQSLVQRATVQMSGRKRVRKPAL